jgi:adenosylcobinamide-phosphate synthase
MGWAIAQLSRFALTYLNSPVLRRGAGIVLGLVITLGSGAGAWGLVAIAQVVHPWLGGGVAVVLLAACFAGRSLRAAAEEVLAPFADGDFVEARSRLSRYVGRDTETLSEPEILRAVLETVSENAVDGVLAPLFYALLGAFTPLGAVPVAIAYKAVSTLDSMVGYRDPPYTEIGCFSARLEDGLTWLPCRCAVLTISVLSGQPRSVWALCLRDARFDPSPNSGWSECAYAAALGVQLGGTNSYRGQIKQKPLLGDPFQPLAVDHIQSALGLTRSSFLLWLSLGCTVLIGWDFGLSLFKGD